MVTIPTQPYTSFTVTDRSELNTLKKLVKALGLEAGLSEHQLGKVDIIIAEITTNCFKHVTGHCEILFRKIKQDQHTGIEVISIDHGPGMQDALHMLQDGISTKDTLGLGMGAIKRQSDQFNVYSRKGWGTLLLSRIFSEVAQPIANKQATSDFSTLIVPYPGETACGDGIFYKVSDKKHIFLVTDGLGHGPQAQAASQQAGDVFYQSASTDPVQLMKEIHRQLGYTRGAAGMAIVLNTAQQTIDCCGIGNIAMRMVMPEKSKQSISNHGILGHNIPSHLLTAHYDRQDHALLVMHSDGLSSHWSIKEYPELMRREPMLIAAALYKDYKREKDDLCYIDH